MSDLTPLIQRWCAGDEQAAEALYNHCQVAIFRLAYGILGNPKDAEEVAQDALTYALLNIQQYDPQRAKFTTWLHTITVSRCRNRLKRKQFLTLSLADWLTGGGDAPDPALDQENYLIHKESCQEVWQAVQGLKPVLREAILLRYWAGHSFREMADILGCPMPTAQSRVRLAYKKLRQTLSSPDFVPKEAKRA